MPIDIHSQLWQMLIDV